MLLMPAKRIEKRFIFNGDINRVRAHKAYA